VASGEPSGTELVPAQEQAAEPGSLLDRVKFCLMDTALKIPLVLRKEVFIPSWSLLQGAARPRLQRGRKLWLGPGSILVISCCSVDYAWFE